MSKFELDAIERRCQDYALRHGAFMADVSKLLKECRQLRLEVESLNHMLRETGLSQGEIDDRSETIVQQLNVIQEMKNL